MQIKEAKIFNFGKIQHQTFSFSNGINVIYGENEAGKSTLQQFLTAMLFGMEKGRGRANLADAYTRYEPWHAPSYYCGALRFEVGEKDFYLERNFYHKDKSEHLRCETDGEELSVAYGDLEMLFGGIGKDAFGNTYHITQSGAVTGPEMTELLTSYLANAAEGGEGSVHVRKALGALQVRRKELAQQQKGMQQEKQQRRQTMEVESQLLQQDCEKLRERRAEFLARNPETVEAVDDVSMPDIGNSVSSYKKVSVIEAVAVLLAVILIPAGCVGMLPFKAVLFGVIALIAIAAISSVVRFTNWKKESRRVEKEQQEQAYRRSEAEQLQSYRRQREEFLAQITEPLLEKEMRLFNLQEQMAELEICSYEERNLQENIEALLLAEQELARLAKEYYEDIEDELNGSISKWVSYLTAGAYDSVRLDDTGKIFILTNGREVLPQMLSRGTLEQIYLSLRLAVGNVLSKEEDMPVFLDEAFAMYDDKRLKETLRALSATGKQIFIFTCQKREMQILQELGIMYKPIFLGDRAER